LKNGFNNFISNQGAFMKKNLLTIIVFAGFVAVQMFNSANAHKAFNTPHQAFNKPHTGFTAQVVSRPAARVYPVQVRPIFYRPGGAVISSGVNYIDRNIGTGEIKQVVQVAPPPAVYTGGYYY